MANRPKKSIGKSNNPQQHRDLRLALDDEPYFVRCMNTMKPRKKSEIIRFAEELVASTAGLSLKKRDLKMMAMIYSLSEKTTGWEDLYRVFEGFKASSLRLSPMMQEVISNPKEELFRVSDHSPVGQVEYTFGLIDHIPTWAFGMERLVLEENRRAANLPFQLPTLPTLGIEI